MTVWSIFKMFVKFVWNSFILNVIILKGSIRIVPREISTKISGGTPEEIPDEISGSIPDF